MSENDSYVGLPKISPLSAVAQELLSRTNKLSIHSCSSTAVSSSLSSSSSPSTTVSPPVPSTPTDRPQLNIDEAVRSLQCEILPIHDLAVPFTIHSTVDNIPAHSAYDTTTSRCFLPYYRYLRPDLQIVVKKQCDLWAYVWTSTSILSDIMVYTVSLIGRLGTDELAVPNTGSLSYPPSIPSSSHGTTASLPFPLSESSTKARTNRRSIIVVELGCGSGLASLATVKYGRNSNNHPVHVISTDLVMDALYLLTKNACLNHLTVTNCNDTVKDSENQSYRITKPYETIHSEAHDSNTIAHNNTITMLPFDWNNDHHIASITAMIHSFIDRSEVTLLPHNSHTIPLTILMGADILFASWTVKPLVKVISSVFMDQFTTIYSSIQSSQLQQQQSNRTDSRNSQPKLHEIFRTVLPPMAILVDPGRTNRDDLEIALQDYTFPSFDFTNLSMSSSSSSSSSSYQLRFAYQRIDMHHIYTPIATMKECTVFFIYLDISDRTMTIPSPSSHASDPPVSSSSSISIDSIYGSLTSNTVNKGTVSSSSLPTDELTYLQRFYIEWRKGITNIELRSSFTGTNGSTTKNEGPRTGTPMNHSSNNTGYTLPIIK